MSRPRGSGASFVFANFFGKSVCPRGVVFSAHSNAADHMATNYVPVRTVSYVNAVQTYAVDTAVRDQRHISDRPTILKIDK